METVLAAIRNVFALLLACAIAVSCVLGTMEPLNKRGLPIVVGFWCATKLCNPIGRGV